MRSMTNPSILCFPLNFAWEILQSGFFRGMTEARHGDAVRLCTLATFGDVGIAFGAFWSVAWCSGGRSWPLCPTAAPVTGFTALGLAITLAFERLATQVWGLWAYSEQMPMIPVAEVGVIPILMWMLLPPLIVWFVRRQLTGRTRDVAAQ
jgi:hypothetical protein